MKTAPTSVVLTVIRYLGRIALVLAFGDLVLTGFVVHLAGKSGSVDPVAVGAVGAITTLLGTVIGALGALLVSTREVPADDVVPVSGPSGGPVETVEVEPDKPAAPPPSTEPSRRAR